MSDWVTPDGIPDGETVEVRERDGSATTMIVGSMQWRAAIADLGFNMAVRRKRPSRPPSVDVPTGWPRPATPCDLRPRWAGEFRDMSDWVSFATARLTGATGSGGEAVAAICVDSFGRRCNRGADFMRAEAEGAFPVRYFWECE